MKKNILLYIAAVAGLFLAGCAKEQRLEPETTPGQMRFAVSVDGATKAGMDADALKKIGEFYIKVETIEQADPAYDYREIVSWNDESGTWTSSHPMLWKNENAAIKYTAVASGWLEDLEEPEPFNTVLPAIFTEEGGTMAIFDKQSYSLSLAASDLLSMTATDLAYSKTTGGVVPVTFTHALAKVNFQLNLAEGYFDNYIGLDEESPIDAISIDGVHLVYNFKALTGVVTVDPNYYAAAVEPFESNYVPGTKADKVSKATFEAVLIPETFAVGALELNFSILGVNFKWTNDKELTLAQGQEYTIPVAVSYEDQPGPPVPPAPLTGVFSVSANKKVSFSRGNLQATYDGADWTWGFAENQWDRIGGTSGNMSITGSGTLSAPGTVDLFCWSVNTDESYYGINMGSNKKEEEAQYVGDFKEWGKILGFGYRTLSHAEWAYLIDERKSGSTVNSTSNARYTLAAINTDGASMRGLLLFPDDVTIEASEATTWADINEVNFQQGYGTKCTTAEWAALAAKGCVFLPAAGERYWYDNQWWVGMIDAGAPDEGGFYWSSDENGTYNAYVVAFRYRPGGSQIFVNVNSNMSRNQGRSVRLVKDVVTSN